MHAAIVFRELRRNRLSTRVRSHRTVLCCGIDPGPSGLVMVAMMAMLALFIGWLGFRVLGLLPLFGERLYRRLMQARLPRIPPSAAAPRDAAFVDAARLADRQPKLSATRPPHADVAGSEAVSNGGARTGTLIKMIAVVVALTVLAIAFAPTYCDYTPRAKVVELILAGSSYRTAIAEKFESDRDPGNAGAGLVFNPAGRISGGSVSRDGTIVINGSTAGTSVGFAVTVIITPSYDTGTGTVIWKCVGQPSAYMPATCR